MSKTTNTTDTTDKNQAIGTIKTFKSSQEVENFYRFIHDNNLRAEAKQLVELVLKTITTQKKRGRKKTLQ